MTEKPTILQLNQAGLPQQWINYEKAAYYYCKDLISWVVGLNEITLNGGVSRITGNQSRLNVNSIIAVKGKVSTRAYEFPPTLTNKLLFRRDGCICAYCQKTFDHKILTRDHVHARARGGKDNWMNVVTSCKACNNFKGDRLLSDIDMKLYFHPYIPTRAESMILSNRNILDDQFDFLLKQVGEKSRVPQLYNKKDMNNEK